MKIKIYIILFIVLTSYAFARIKEEKGLLINKNSLYRTFIPNKGQWDFSIKFIGQTKNYFLIFKNNTLKLKSKTSFYFKNLDNKYELTFNNSNLNEIEFKNRLNSKINYFVGNDSNNWISNIHSYQKIIIKNIYSDIDLIFSFHNDTLKYDFVLKKDANPNDIRFAFDDNYSKKDMQEDNSVFHKRISLNKRKDNSNRIQSIISTEIYSTYLGGNKWDTAEDMVLDKSGNIYVVGYTNSTDFPTSDSAFSRELKRSVYKYPDIFVSKFDSSGQNLIFSTFIGGFLDDFGKSIAIDDSLNIYITGYTGPTQTFPFTKKAYDTSFNGSYDVFVIKLNPTGSKLLFSTFFGGANDDYAHEIELDNKNNIYICGFTMDGNDFPITKYAIQDTSRGKNEIFISKLNNSGDSLIYSTLLGGSEDDFAEAFGLDKDENIYVSGMTRSRDFPISQNAFDSTYNDSSITKSTGDVFLTKLDKNGFYILYSTFLGGFNKDIAYSMDFDKYSNLYITGSTESKNFPVTAYAYDTLYRSKEGNRNAGDIFVTKFNTKNDSIIYSTYLGGSSADRAFDIKIDNNCNAYVIGSTSSNDLEVSKHAVDKRYNDSSFGADVLISVLDSTGHNLLYSSFYGGDDSDVGNSLQLFNNDYLYFVGTTKSSNFPTTASAFSSTFNNDSASNAFIAIIKPNLLNFDAGEDKYICKGDLVRLGDSLRGAKGSATFTWTPSLTLDDVNAQFPIANPKQSTSYTVHIIDDKGFEDWDTVNVFILPFFDAIIYGPKDVYGHSLHSYGTKFDSTVKYSWIVSGGIIKSGDSTNVIDIYWTDDNLGTILLMTENEIGCRDTSELFIVNIGKDLKPKIIPLGDTVFCEGDSCILDGGKGYIRYIWSNGKQTRYDTVRTTGEYWVLVNDSLGNQISTDTIKIIVLAIPNKPFITYDKTNNLLTCMNTANAYQWYLNSKKLIDSTNKTMQPDRAGYYQCEIANSNGCTNISDSLKLTLGSVIDLKNDKSILIYPNPNDGILHIEIKNENIYFLKITLFNLLGEKIWEKNVKNLTTNNFTFNLNCLDNGFYYIELQLNKKIYGISIIFK